MPQADRHTFPFSAIVGQEALSAALLVNAIDPRVGGVLIRGQKGTAKSTAVRGLQAVLPEIEVAEGCRYGCDPALHRQLCDECRTRRASGPLPSHRRRPHLVELPVSATEDRVVGTIDLEHALKHGERRFEAGLLADANRGILYIDEVNLLDDHIVDTLLDSAASGINVVEREGVRHAHPARFILVGTMNPEEGELRPQLLDRFGLCVDVEGITDPDSRVEIVRRRRSFEDDTEAFLRRWSQQDAMYTERVSKARAHLADLELDDELLYLISSVCASMGVDGHRADLVMGRAAIAWAVLDGRREVTARDVREVAPLVLAHRMRRTPFDDNPLDQARLDKAFASASPAQVAEAPAPRQSNDPSDGPAPGRLSPAPADPVGVAPGSDVSARLTAEFDRMKRSADGRRQLTRSDDATGRYVRSEPFKAGMTPDIALDATIRAAAPHQSTREGDLAIRVTPDDLRNKVRKRRVGASIVFCVDASGSMGATNRMEAAKAAVFELLVDAYQRRDRVGLVAFRGDSAEVVLQPTASVELAQLKLRTIPTGGATPLAHGIVKSQQLLASEIRRDTEVIPWLILVTDGKGNVGMNGGLGSEDARAAAGKLKEARINTLVIDAAGGISARELARVAGGDYVRLGALEGGNLAGAVRDRVGNVPG